METELKIAHLELIIKTEENLIELMNAGLLSKETVREYIILLNEKFVEITNQLF
jgi:hypothetical protein